MRLLLLLLALLPAVTGCPQRNAGVEAPKPLYTDPVNHGPTDPEIVQNRETGQWYMFYTSRRADLRGPRRRG